MKQTTKTMIGLCALLAVAGAIGGAALWAGKDEARKAEAKEKSEKLFDFDKARVKSLRISKDGQVAAALEKGEKGWKLTQPVQADGDDSAVDSLITSLTSLRQKKDLPEEKDLKAFGLDAPRLEVAVKLDDGKEQGLQIGIENSFDSTLYVKKLADSTVRVIDGYQKSSFDKGAFDLRDKRVTRGDEVKKLEVAGVKAPYVLEKDGSNWKYNGAAADGANADRVVNAVKSLRATGVAAESARELKQFGLDKPKITARLDGKPVFIGVAGAKTYAKRDDSPVVYEVDGAIVKDLDKQPFELQDKSLVHADREAVRKVVFDSPAGKVEVTRAKTQPPDGGYADEVFEVISPQKGPAKKWRISSALYSITGLKAAAFEGPVPKDLAKYGLDKPRTVSLFGEGDKLLARVRIGAEKDNKRYALADGVDKLARVEKVTVDEWPWTPAEALESPPTPQASK